MVGLGWGMRRPSWSERGYISKFEEFCNRLVGGSFKGLKKDALEERESPAANGSISKSF